MTVAATMMAVVTTSATDDDDDHPRRSQLQLDQRDECRHGEQFVCDGIEECPDGRHLAPAARQEAVEPVGGRGDEKDHDGDDLTPIGKPRGQIGEPGEVFQPLDAILDPHRGPRRSEQNHDEKGNEKDAQECEGIRKIQTHARCPREGTLTRDLETNQSSGRRLLSESSGLRAASACL